MTDQKDDDTPTFIQYPGISAALAALQQELPTVVKGETGEVSGQSKGGKDYRYTYQYADLADVTDALMPILGKHGLSYTTAPRLTDKGYILECTLLHTSGEYRTAEWVLPLNASPQQTGSSITYGRRYCLTAMTGVAPRGDDDDAAKHQQQYERMRSEQRQQETRQNEAAAPEDPRNGAFAALRSVARTKGLGEGNVPGAFAQMHGKIIGDATLEEIQEYTAFIERTGTLQGPAEDDAGDTTPPPTEEDNAGQ